MSQWMLTYPLVVKLALPAPPVQGMPQPEPLAVPEAVGQAPAVPGPAAVPQPGHIGFLAMTPPRTMLQAADPGVPLAAKADLLQPPLPQALPPLRMVPPKAAALPLHVPPAYEGEPPPRRRRLEQVMAFVPNRGWRWVINVLEEEEDEDVP